jgi:hypothetical protein
MVGDPRRAPDPGIGILMLDTGFHRFPGDVGNPATWPFPVTFRVVRGASPQRVVFEEAEGLLEPFVEAGRELAALGVRGIATSCGFLALFQRELAARLPVPVATSSLLQVPVIQALLPAGRRVGVLTASARALTPRHLAAVGADPTTPTAGFDDSGLFLRVYGGRGGISDFEALEAEAVAAARALVRRHPEVGAIVCECTNLPPHSRAIARATGLPVYDVVGFVGWFARGLAPPAFPR